MSIKCQYFLSKILPGIHWSYFAYSTSLANTVKYRVQCLCMEVYVVLLDQTWLSACGQVFRCTFNIHVIYCTSTCVYLHAYIICFLIYMCRHVYCERRFHLSVALSYLLSLLTCTHMFVLMYNMFLHMNMYMCTHVCIRVHICTCETNIMYIKRVGWSNSIALY